MLHERTAQNAPGKSLGQLLWGAQTAVSAASSGTSSRRRIMRRRGGSEWGLRVRSPGRCGGQDLVRFCCDVTAELETRSPHRPRMQILLACMCIYYAYANQQTDEEREVRYKRTFVVLLARAHAPNA